MSVLSLNDKPTPQPAKVQPLGLFETPLAYGSLTDGDALISELKSLILQRMNQSPGLERSNIGGWHSDTDMLDWGGRPAQKLAQTAINIAKRMSHFQDSSVADREWLVRMWANVTPAGGLNHLHSHPGNLWAAVLYIDMGHGLSRNPVTRVEAFTWKIRDFPWLRCVTPPFECGGSTASLSSTRQKLSSSVGILSCFRHGCGTKFDHTPERESVLLLR